MSNGDFILLPVFVALPTAVNQEVRQSPLGARRRNSTRASGVILESRKHSALTWPIKINTTWHRERKQMAVYSYINIFLHYVICIKFC
jgi:hypothetical protein